MQNKLGIRDSVILWNPIRKGLSQLLIVSYKTWCDDMTIPYKSSWGACNRAVNQSASIEVLAQFLTSLERQLSRSIDSEIVTDALCVLVEYKGTQK